MKQRKIWLGRLAVAILIVAGILIKQKPQVRQHNSQRTSQRAKKPVIKPTWGYPFQRLYEKRVKFKSGQKFGKTDVQRRFNPPSYFHDGYDFGYSEVGHKAVLAVHPGVVHRVKFRAGMGLYVWVISKDGYVEIYQEGFVNDFNIYVKKGQHLKLGQKIGRLTGSHLHLGITKTNKHYIDKHGDPCGNWWKNNGTWLDPMKIINAGLGSQKPMQSN
jgi:murein DD-endopeptidase